MRVKDLMVAGNWVSVSHKLVEQCSDFIRESQGEPMLKNLPRKYDDFQKVKVRKRKQRTGDPQEFAELFNTAFEDEANNLRERSIFANGESSFKKSEDANKDAFYIFPIDGFNFMYCREVKNSTHDYMNAFSAIMEQVGIDKGRGLITEMLKFNYVSENIYEGINTGAEIIIYNIPYFYAMRRDSVEDYSTFFEAIREKSNGY